MTSAERPAADGAAPAADGAAPATAAPGAEPLLELRDLSASAGRRRVLRDVRLEVRRGEIHAVVGGRGSGKSSLVKVISGCLQRDGGAILFAGQPLERHTPQNALRLGITTLHQEDRLLPQMSACENIFLNREPRRWGLFSDKRRMREATRRAFAAIPLSVDPDLPVRFHDANTQQMILVSRLFCFPSRLVVLDEVAGRLTPEGLERLHYLLSVLRRDGVTILYVGADPDEVANFATRVSILEGGTIARTTQLSNLDEDGLVRLTHASLFSRRKLESSNLELHYLNHLSRNILDSIPVPLLVADSKGAVRLVNRALLELSRLPAGELLRADAGGLLPEAAAAGRDAPPAAAVRLADRRPPFLREGLRADILVTPLVDPDDAYMGTVCLFSPLGAAGEPVAGGATASGGATVAEGEAEARREEGRRLAELAHEINNPLGILLNYLKLIRSGGSLEQVHADAEVMSGEIRRIKRILGRFQQGGRGRRAAAPGTAGVRAVIDGVIALLQLKLQQLEGENPVTVEIETEEEPRLAVEADLLRQVVLNVAMNGIEAMPGGGPLSIRVRPAGGGRLAIEVRDEGVGIPAEDLERIFEPFFTTKELRAPPGREGTRGLGLPLSRDIVCRHGGTIEVESAPGKGSTFRILLPLPLPD